MSGYGDQLSAWVKAKREPQGVTVELVTFLDAFAKYQHQHQPDRTAELQAQYDASGAITPGEVVELRSGTINVRDCQGFAIEPLPDGEQRAAFAKYQDQCIAALAKAAEVPAHMLGLEESQERPVAVITTAAQADELFGAGSIVHAHMLGLEESQERAVAPNLQLPASSGSSDGAEVPGAYKRAFEELRHECQRLDAGRIEAEQGFAEAASNLGGAESEVADLKRQLADARQLYANRDAADEELAAWQRETLAEAAAQFRSITGDFPGLTGPLVDLFKDVK